MDENEMDGQEVLETPEEELDLEEAEQLTAEELSELRAKAAKADELEEKNKQLFERVKKGEQKVPSKDSEIANKDILYLAKADINEDDVNEILEWSKFKKVSVKEAHEALKPMLSVRNEQRKTAAATNTNTSARGGSKIDGATLLQNASAGKLPDDDAGIAALVAAEMEAKTRK